MHSYNKLTETLEESLILKHSNKMVQGITREKSSNILQMN